MLKQTDHTVEWEGEGAIFRLENPRRLNAITNDMLDGLTETLDELERRKGRYLIITGEGDKAFSAGTDLHEARAGASDPRNAGRADRARGLFYRLSKAPVISVAALNGLAYGGGLELAMACTFRIAAPHVRLSLPEIKLGVLPSYGGTQFLTALVGRSRALELMLTGRVVAIDEAVSLGLVDHVLQGPENVVARSKTFVNSIMAYSQVAIDGVRACVEVAGETVTQAGLDAEGNQVARVSASHDADEGIAAFLEKRAPVFRHT